LWIALAALAYIMFRELGFSRMRKYPLALLVLVLSLTSLPAGGVYILSRPYQARILARIVRRQAPPVNLSSGCSIFPPNNIWNARVMELPLDPQSAAYIQSMGPELPLHPDFGLEGGIPYGIAAADQPASQVTFTDGSESDPGPYFIPDHIPLESGPDAHLLVLDSTRCRLYELFAAVHTGAQQWQAGSGAIFDLRSNLLRPAGWTSADAAGLPILPGLIRADEVLSGEIRHALRFTTRRTRRTFVWPARHFASSVTDPNLPPMGQRFRLKSSVDIGAYSQQAQVILRALKAYGMLLSDNGGPWYLTGATDSRWSSQLVTDFRGIHGSDFEAVDSSGLMVSPDSAQARQ
jgi:hypothetical protein